MMNMEFKANCKNCAMLLNISMQINDVVIYI